MLWGRAGRRVVGQAGGPHGGQGTTHAYVVFPQRKAGGEDWSHCRVAALLSQTQLRASLQRPPDSPKLDTLPQARKELVERWIGKRLQGDSRPRWDGQEGLGSSRQQLLQPGTRGCAEMLWGQSLASPWSTVPCHLPPD